MDNKRKFLVIISLLFLFLSAVTIGSDLIIESKVQHYVEKEHIIRFLGDVKVTYEDITVVGDTADVSTTKDNKLDTATFYDKPYAFQINNNKKREVKANILKLSLLNKVIKAEGDTQTTVIEGKTPIVLINADEQEYDTRTNVMTATGRVTIKYRDLKTFSDKAVIKTDKDGEVQRIDLYGHAKVDRLKDHAIADHFIYDAKTEEAISIGHTMTSTITDSGSEFKITANYQQYDKKKNTFMGSGNVEVFYEDYYAKSPKINCYPDRETQKINEVYMTGRSMIRQNEKEIYADKIRIFVDPKDFEAVGNVKSVIRNIGESNKSNNGGFI